MATKIWFGQRTLLALHLLLPLFILAILIPAGIHDIPVFVYQTSRSTLRIAAQNYKINGNAGLSV
jgi:hypothetical protein